MPVCAPGSATGISKVVALGSHVSNSTSSGHWLVHHRYRGGSDGARATPEWWKFDDAAVSQEKLGYTRSKACRRAVSVFAYATDPGGSVDDDSEANVLPGVDRANKKRSTGKGTGNKKGKGKGNNKGKGRRR